MRIDRKDKFMGQVCFEVPSLGIPDEAVISGWFMRPNRESWSLVEDLCFSKTPLSEVLRWYHFWRRSPLVGHLVLEGVPPNAQALSLRLIGQYVLRGIGSGVDYASVYVNIKDLSTADTIDGAYVVNKRSGSDNSNDYEAVYKFFHEAVGNVIRRLESLEDESPGRLYLTDGPFLGHLD